MGDHTVRAKGATSDRVATTEFSVAALDEVTIASDYLDYPPGALVTLTGTGWSGDSAVKIVVNDTYGASWYRSVDVVVDDEGGVTDSFNLPEWFVSDYNVKAIGNNTGRIAEATFRDAAADIDQCRNGGAASPANCDHVSGSSGWGNGNVNATQAHMVEGYSTPFRIRMDGLPTDGTVIELVIGHDVKHSDKHAYDFLTSASSARLDDPDHGLFFPTPAPHPNPESIDPLVGTGAAGPPSTFVIPPPSNLVGAPLVDYTTIKNAGQAEMALYGGSISDIQYVSPGDLSAKTSTATIKVTFTATTSQAVLAWGGHIARCQSWGKDAKGACKSAGGISGSPYHMYLEGWSLNTLGQQDRSLQASAVIVPGGLSLTKELAEGSEPFEGKFTIHYECTLDKKPTISGDVQLAAGETQVIGGIDPGYECVISEPDLPDAPDYAWGTPQFSPSNTVTIEEGTTVSVTTTNDLTRNRGTFTIEKSLTNDDGAPVPASFTVNYDCGIDTDGDPLTGERSIAPGSPATVSGVPTGNTCSVTEVAPDEIPGYTWQQPITYSPESIEIGEGEGPFAITVGNTITKNRGTFTIEKSLTNDDGAPVPASFTVNYDCGIDTDGDPLTGERSIAPGSPATVSGVPTGNTCSVTEVAPDEIPGYTWQQPITYSPESIEIGEGEGPFAITVGNTITKNRGTFTIEKSLTNDDGAPVPASFTVNYDCGIDTDGDPLTGERSIAPGSPATVSGVPTGNTCSVTEVAPDEIPGYTWQQPITYSPESIEIGEGEGPFAITVGNTITKNRGTFTIEKSLTNDDGAPVPASFTVNYDCGIDTDGDPLTGERSIAPGSPATVSGVPTGNTCSVTEVAPDEIPGYTWQQPITYSPESIEIGEGEGPFAITVGNTITKNRGTFTIEKSLTNDDGAPVPASFTVNYDCGIDTDGDPLTGERSIAPGSPATVSGVPTGNTCSVTEVAPDEIPGYTWQQPITYSPESIEIGEGEGPFAITVGNTITKNRGTFTIEKSLTNDDGAPVPASFTVNYDCGIDTDGDPLTGERSIAPGSPATVSGVPTGNTCSVTEVAPDEIPGYTWQQPITYSPESIEIGEGEGPFAITVGNTITKNRGSLIVNKILNGTAPEGFDSVFSIGYDCGVDTDESPIKGNADDRGWQVGLRRWNPDR